MHQNAITTKILDGDAWKEADLKGLSTANLEQLTYFLALEEEVIKKRKDRLQGLLSERFAKDLEPGTHYTDSQGQKVRIEVPKKIEWDQEVLRVAADTMRKSGQDPREYIEYKMFIPETKYRSWPRFIQQKFEPARTISPGKPKITFVQPDPAK